MVLKAPALLSAPLPALASAYSRLAVLLGPGGSQKVAAQVLGDPGLLLLPLEEARQRLPPPATP